MKKNEENKKRPSLFGEEFLNQYRNHASLIGSGISAEQSLRIAYGDEEAEEVMRMINEIEQENPNASFFNLKP